MPVVNIRIYPGSDYVYIGRAGNGQDGYFGNPVVVGKPCPECGSIHSERGQTLPCFETYARRRMWEDDIYASRVRSLKGKKLGCFCWPAPCHGNILEKLASEK